MPGLTPPLIRYEGQLYRYDPLDLRIYPVQAGRPAPTLPRYPLPVANAIPPGPVRRLIVLLNGDHHRLELATFQRLVDQVQSDAHFALEQVIFSGAPLDSRRLLTHTIQYLRQASGFNGRLTLLTGPARLSLRLLSFLGQQRVEIALRLDGPLAVHDALHRRGAHARTLPVWHGLAAAGLAALIHSVYTARHIAAGWTLTTLLRYYEDLGVTRLHLTPDPRLPASLPPGDPARLAFLDSWRGGAAYALASLLSTDQPIFVSSLMAGLDAVLYRRWRERWCTAGVETLTLAPDGYLLPCAQGPLAPLAVAHWLAAPAELDTWLSGNRLRLVKDAPACAACWLAASCANCAAHFIHAGRAFDPDPLFCDLQRIAMEEVIAFVIQSQLSGLMPDLVARLKQGGALQTANCLCG